MASAARTMKPRTIACTASSRLRMYGRQPPIRRRSTIGLIRRQQAWGIIVQNANPARGSRRLLDGRNRLKLGLFGANCSSGRNVTKVPERWSGTWPDNLTLARMADEAGIDFMLPIGRWKGYG